MNLNGEMSISFCMKANRKKQQENNPAAGRARIPAIRELDEPVVRMWGKTQLEVEEEYQRIYHQRNQDCG